MNDAEDDKDKDDSSELEEDDLKGNKLNTIHLI